MSGTLVFDEEAGIAYEAYNAELIRAFLILKYYTDMDLAEYDNSEGRCAVHDALASHGLWREIMEIVDLDMDDVDVIAYKLGSSARRSFEEKHSLSRMLMKTFGALLGTEDLTQTVAKAEALNGKLIDMLAAVQKQPTANTGGLKLAKKG